MNSLDFEVIARLNSNKQLHDVMLGTKKKLGIDAFGETCVYLQPAAKLFCSALLDVPLYLKFNEQSCTQFH